jgi:gamma-glutamylcyclotransferase (GGCT)/AIG2-like uncharacterized protein YtfP
MQEPTKSKRGPKGQQTLKELEETMGYGAIDLLKPEHERFCWHYATYGNGRAAYQHAYPDVTEGTARSKASLLVTNNNIITRLDEIRTEMKERYATTADEVVRYHSAVLKFDRSELTDKLGSVKKLHELPMDVAALLDMEMQVTKGGGQVALLKIPTRSAAAAELARIHGLYKDKLQLTGDVAQMSVEEMKAELALLAKETLEALNAQAPEASL